MTKSYSFPTHSRTATNKTKATAKLMLVLAAVFCSLFTKANIAGPGVSTSTAICPGYSATMVATGGTTSYSWAPATRLSVTTGSTVVATPAATTIYTVTINDGGDIYYRMDTIVVSPIPTITMSPALTGSVCLGNGLSFTASAAGVTTGSATLLSQNFNTGLTDSTGGVWTVVNTGPGSSYNWARTAPGGWFVNFLGDGTEYFGAEPNFAEANLITTLYSPVFSTIGYGTGTVNFDRFRQVFSADNNAEVDYSIDGGTTWHLVKDYAGDYDIDNVFYPGAPNQVDALPAGMMNQPSVQLRWYYNSNGSSFWAIDNITVTVQPNSSIVWAGISGATGISCTNCGTTTLTPIVTGENVYTVIATLNGCKDTSGVAINVRGLPSVSTSPNASICGSSSATLTAAGGVSYSWAPSTGLSAITGTSVSANPAATTTYTVTGTDINGCVNNAAVTVTNSGVLPIFAGASTAICPGFSATLTAAGGTTYSWAPSTGLTVTTGASVVATPAESTVYTVTGTSGSCSNTALDTVIVNPIPTITMSPALTGSVCIGSGLSFTASAVGVSGGGATLLSQNFNTGMTDSTGGVWTVVNTGPGSSYNWARTAPGGWFVNFLGDGTEYFGAEPNFAEANLITTLYSPVFSTIGYGTGTVNFDRFRQVFSADNNAEVDYSIDGGTTWHLVKDYAGDYDIDNVFYPGAPNQVDALPAGMMNQPSVQLRWYYNSNGSSFWAIDNITVAVQPSSSIVWTGVGGATGISCASCGTTTLTPAVTGVNTYSVISTLNGCKDTSGVTINVRSLPTVSGGSNVSICATSSATLTATGGVSYSWAPSSGLSANTGVSVSANPEITTTYTVTGTDGYGCVNNAAVTVTNSGAIPVSAGLATSVCPGFSATLTATGAAIYSWAPSAGLSVTTGASVIATPAESTIYTVTGTSGSCSNTAFDTVVVNPAPAISITPALTGTVCLGSVVPFTASATGVSGSGATLLSQNFNTGLTDSTGGVWTVVNTGPGSSYNWARTAPGGWFVNFLGDGTEYFGAEPNFAEANLITTLYSPVFSTIGYGTGTVNFDRFRQVFAADNNAEVDYSIDGGATWQLVKDYAGDYDIDNVFYPGSPNQVDALPVGMMNQPSVQLRWYYNSNGSSFWAIDNITVTVQPSSSIAWTGISGATGISCASCGATTLTPTVTGENTYSVIATLNGCSDTSGVTVTVNPIPNVVVSLPSQAVCNNATSTPISFTGTVTGTANNWTNTDGTIGIAVEGSGNIANFTAINGGSSIKTATVTVTPSANGCTGATQSTVYTVYPTPVLISTLTPASVCDNATFTYTSGSATIGTSFTWSRASTTGISNTAASGAGAISEILTDTTVNPVSVAYVDTLRANGCVNTQTVTVTLEPNPMLSTLLNNGAICDSTAFTYVPNSLTTGTAYTWSRSVVAGISNTAGAGMGAINEILINTTVDPQVVTYIDTLHANGCINTQSVTVTVNPLPKLSTPLAAGAVCSSSPFVYGPNSLTGGTTYTWSRNVVAGISNTAGSGAGTINEALINTTAAQIVVMYVDTLHYHGCINTQTITMTVNPTPVLTSTLTPAAICDNTQFLYVPTSATEVATFTWSRDTVTGISNAAANGVDTTNEILVNITANPVSVVYMDTLHAYGCINTQSVTVTVYPLPLLTSALTASPICDSTVFNYTPESDVSGPSFAWSRAAVSGISNAAASGAGDPAEQLVNITTGNETVTYTYVVTANGCSGNPYNVAVTVRPTPRMLPPYSDSICSGIQFSYIPDAATAGTSFSWSRALATGISNAAGNGSDTIREVLTNTTTAAVTPVYVYTMTYDGCTAKQDITLKVNPVVSTPVIATEPASSLCGNVMYQNFGAATAEPTGETYNWTATGAQVWATGNTHQYALINFPEQADAVISLTATSNTTKCFSQATYNVSVSSNISEYPEVVYSYGQFICLQNNEDSYQWGYDDKNTLDSTLLAGEINQNYVNANPGNDKIYWVMVTSNGCTQKAYSNAPTGVANVNAGATDVKIYPNPATEIVNVDISSTVGGNMEVEVLNVLGQHILLVPVANNRASFNVSNLPAGAYFVNCYRDGVKLHSAKIIKN